MPGAGSNLARVLSLSALAFALTAMPVLAQAVPPAGADVTVGDKTLPGSPFARFLDGLASKDAREKGELGRLGVAAALHVLQHAPAADELVRADALAAAIAGPDPEAAIAASRVGSVMLQRLAAEGKADYDLRRALIRALHEAAGAKHPRVRHASVDALRNSRDDASVPVLIETLGDTDPLVRLAALTGLIRWTDGPHGPAILAAVEKLRTDPDESLRRIAEKIVASGPARP